MTELEPVSGAVLAGGRSTRMGRDKRFIEVDGVPLLDRAIRAVRAVADDVYVVTSDASDRGSDTVTSAGVDWLVEPRPGQGPLAAIEAALAGAEHTITLVVAGDHPYLEVEVLRLLVATLGAHDRAAMAALVTDHGPQPLLAAYRRDALATVRDLLDDGERRALALLDHLPVVPVGEDLWRPVDPHGWTSVDLDTPEDVAASRRVARAPVVTVDARGSSRSRHDTVVVEEPLAIRAHGPGQAPVTVVTTMRTPGHDTELAVGWLHGEGLLRPGDVEQVTIGDPVRSARPDDELTVRLKVSLDLDAAAERHAVATASCGVCGRASIDELAARCPPVPTDVPPGGALAWPLLAALPGRMRAAQAVFADTGGLHATGLFTTTGTLLTLREDVGRHNALDAAIGRHVLDGSMPLHDRVATLSGRVGFELVAKVAMAGIPVVVAVGAATDLAARTADRLGVTLVSFVRDGGGNIHTHPHRIAC